MVARRIPRAVAHDPPDDEANPPKGDTLTAARLSWLEAFAAVKISPLEYQLAIVLALRYVSRWKSRERFKEQGVPIAWPPQVTLAEELGCTRQAVAAAVRRLAGRGYLQILKAGRGRGHATEYALVGKGKQLDCLLEPRKRQAAASEKANPDSTKGKKRSQKRQAGCLPQSLSLQSTYQSHSQFRNEAGDFLAGVKGVRTENDGRWPKRRHDGDGKYPELEEIIDIWPNKKIDEGKAKGAWINNVISEQLKPSRVLQRARAWCNYWEEERPKFIPYLGKWLAEAGWEEDPPETTWQQQYRHEERMGLNRRRPSDDGGSADADSPD